MNDKTDQQELISALADGQLEGEALKQALAAACADGEARAAWQAYHVIGDVLRSPDLARGADPLAFVSRLNERIATERPQPAPLMPPLAVRPAANDSNFRWKLAAGFASFMAVAAIGWNVAGTATPLQPQLAAGPAAVVPVAVASGGRPQMMIRDPNLDRLLAAHRQLGGGATALQQPAGFLRNATFEAPAR
ncbi:sigma-E factor negative regulatory protein [Ramlibacter albus]|uniref:Sigma-E factor negative regulatory protein n=1 Tax=Ramlibacter albus TaxID=2079448 RepID=A0A923MF37_9BURK|nr:sigma-E factor negative regulatory protein [Ramlibacter albus]MBC5768373.1 sigma-E factor negative regulatory protein [Ramlibacter albus]